MLRRESNELIIWTLNLFVVDLCLSLINCNFWSNYLVQLKYVSLEKRWTTLRACCWWMSRIVTLQTTPGNQVRPQCEGVCPPPLFKELHKLKDTGILPILKMLVRYLSSSEYPATDQNHVYTCFNGFIDGRPSKQ